MYKVICQLTVSISLILLSIILAKNFDHSNSMHAFGQVQVMCSNGSLVSSSTECPSSDVCPSVSESNSVIHCSAEEISSSDKKYGTNSKNESGAPTSGSIYFGSNKYSLAIFTDKQIYKKGEIVKITVKNNSTTPMRLRNTNSLTIANLQTGESYPPSLIPIRPKIFLPGESSFFEWDQHYPLLNSSKLVNSGNYSASISIGPLIANTTFSIVQ